MSGGGGRAPEPGQMSNEERQLMFEQAEALRQQRSMLNTMWGQQQFNYPQQQELSTLQNMAQLNQQQNMMGWQRPMIDEYNKQTLQNMGQQSGLQGELLNLQRQYAPQQYQTAEQLLNMQNNAMGQFGYMNPLMLQEMNAAGRGATDMPTEAADFAQRSQWMPQEAAGQQQLQKALYDRVNAALSGNLPTDPAMERSIQEQYNTMRAQLERQLGPGWETSSAGIEAGQNFAKRAEELRYTQRNNMLGQAHQMFTGQTASNLQSMMGNQQLAQARLQAQGMNLANRGQDIANTGNRANSLMSIMGQPFGWQMSQPGLMTSGSLGGMMGYATGPGGTGPQVDPGAFGQLAQGFGSAANPYAQQRQMDYQGQLARYQSGGGQSLGDMFGNLGLNMFGMGLGSLFGPAIGMGGAAFGSMLFPQTAKRVYGY